MRTSAQRRPSSVSTAVTRRAPRKPARSVGWRSLLVAVKCLDRRRFVVVAENAGDGREQDATCHSPPVP